MEILIPILILLFLGAGVFTFGYVVFFLTRGALRIGRKTSKVGLKLLMWLCAAAVSGGACWVVAGVIGSPLWTLPHFLESLCYAVLGVLLLLWLLVLFDAARSKFGRILLIAASLCACAVIGVLGGIELHAMRLPTLSEGGNLLEAYNPLNEDNILATLDEPCSLRLTDDLPVFDGATALYPIYAAFANAVYPAEKLGPEFLDCTTTTGAYERVVDGDVDIIFAAAPSEEQLQYASDNGVEMVLTPIGREAFVFFVNAENPVSSLSIDQIRGIYSGEITHWKDLGANLGKIRAFQRDQGSGSQSTMIRFMGDTSLMQPPQEDTIGGMLDVITVVSDYRNHKNAIGYSFRFYANEMVANDQIKLLEISGIAPTKENIRNGSYPVASEFYAVHLASNDNPNIPLLIDWILSDQGQSLIDQTGYVGRAN